MNRSSADLEAARVAEIPEVGVATARARSRPGTAVVPAASLLVTGAATVMWALSLRHVDVGSMSDLGLVSVLHRPFFVALALVTLAFVATIHTRPKSRFLFPHVLALVLMLYLTPSIVEHVPHISATWRHVGIIDYIGRRHAVNAKIDAYFNWPGFFIFAAFITKLAGARTTVEFARWIPFVYDLVFLLPVFLLARTVTSDRRLIWLAVWLFSISNWIGQDYFSPQATTYLLYLVALAVLLSWFPGGVRAWPRFSRRRGSPDERHDLLRVPARSGGTPRQRVALVLAIVVVIAATVPAHQLTPFALLGATTALVVVGACALRTLPLLVLFMIVAWVSFLSVAYIGGHFGVLAGGVGKLDQNVGSNLGGRLHGSPEHLTIIFTRIAVTVGVWMIALVGLARRVRNRQPVISIVVLAAAPFPLIGLQSYGGEVLLRTYLFALPFMAILAASAFFARTERQTSSWTSISIAAVSALLIAGFLVSRYGNERIDYFTGREVQAMRYVSAVARPHASVFSLSRDYPRSFSRYGDFRYIFVSEEPQWRHVRLRPAAIGYAVATVHAAMTGAPNRANAYLIVTRSQLAFLETLTNEQPRALDALVAHLRRSDQFRTVFANRDAFVLKVRST